MRKRWLGVGLLVVMGIAVLVTPLRDSLSDLVAKDDRSGEPPPEETGASPSGDPMLTKAKRRAAQRIVLADRSLEKFTGNRPPKLAGTGPWTSDDGEVLLGAEIELALARRRSIDAQWPSVAFAGPRRYVSRRQRFRADGVSRLTLLVDLRRREVVSIEPDAGAKVTVPEGTKATPPPTNED